MILDNPKLDVVNRDYRSIYKDLINAIPSLTDQWSVSDESDPGVVLVKLMSMIGDMLSYNTDKAYLEAFPDTVTQRKNAYQIFKLIGYKMKWYRSATCDCYFNNASSSLSEVIYLPRFTRFTSPDKTVCYTNPLEDLYIVAGISGADDSRQQTTLIEGIPVTPDVYADTSIYKDGTSYQFNYNSAWHSIYKYNVDKSIINDNKIYFNTKNVEQNYIILIDDNGNQWNMVENIDTASNLNERLFEFDVDEFDKPYIRLIDYWEDLNISKFKLFYIQSSGVNGKINANVLKIAESEAFSLLNDRYPELSIVNAESSDGYDPETPNDARKASANYINTFDTLVTLDDFAKFVKRYEFVGNAIAKDSTNDFSNGIAKYYSSVDDLINKLITEFGINTTSFETLTDTYNFSSTVTYQFDTDNKTLTRSFSTNIWNDITGEYFELLKHIANFFNLRYVEELELFLKPIIDESYNPNREYYFINSDNEYEKFEGSEFDPDEQYFAVINSGDSEVINTSDIYEIAYLSNKNADTELDVDYTDYMKCISSVYNINNNRDIYFDISSMSDTEPLTTGNVNIYITPREGYNFSDYKDELDENIYNTKMMPLMVSTTTNGINYYNWTMNGVVYLKNPVTYNKSQEILVNVNNKLKSDYSAENIGYCNPIKPIDLVNSIMSADPQIYYVDLGNIEYIQHDTLSDEDIGEIITDKTVISGSVYIQDLPYDNFMTSNGIYSSTTFVLDLLNDTYEDSDGNVHKYLEGYTDADILNGNVLIMPGSFCAVIDNGSYIIKDNGYGSLVCNEDILDSSIINYKITDGKLLVKFDISPNITIDTDSTVNIKFNRNKLNMAVYSGLNPNKFIIDNESIEV